MSAPLPSMVFLPRGVHWPRAGKHFDGPIAFTDTIRMARSLVEQGFVTFLVSGVSEQQLSEWLAERGAKSTIFSTKGQPS